MQEPLPSDAETMDQATAGSLTAPVMDVVIGPKTYAMVAASKPRSPVARVKPQASPQRPTMEQPTTPGELRLFDSHFHLDRLSSKLWVHWTEIDNIVNQVTNVLPQTVGTLVGGVLVFCDQRTWFKIPEDCESRWAIAVGIHPKNIPETRDRDIQELKMLLQRPNVSALGEVGLDYSVAPSLWQAQRERLSEVLKLAIPEKVLVLHLRGESRDHLCSKPSEHCLDMVRKCCAPEQKIHLHCFAGSTSIMRA